MFFGPTVRFLEEGGAQQCRKGLDGPSNPKCMSPPPFFAGNASVDLSSQNAESHHGGEARRRSVAFFGGEHV